METVEDAGAQAGIVVAARRTVVGALAALFLTTAHHLYGAYVYATPWRTHVAHVSVIAAAALIGSFVVFRRRAGTWAGEVALWSILLVTLALPVVGIGLFEGGYNHVLKVALYYGHASPGLMARLFPPPTYELPNDALFEITGVLQLALGALAGRHLLLLARERSRLAALTPGRAEVAVTAVPPRRGRVDPLHGAGSRMGRPPRLVACEFAREEDKRRGSLRAQAVEGVGARSSEG